MMPPKSYIKEAILYQSLTEGKVQCNICQRRCKIHPGKRGYCWDRMNLDGKLYTLAYGQVATSWIAPIEIKPMFHFFPGSRALSLGTLGCNFRCPGCQNWDIAHRQIQEDTPLTEYIAPEEAVEAAKNSGCQGVSWTYNEPTVWFEYTLDSAKLAKKNHLYTNYVTNGFISEEALDLIGPYLDSYRVDIKGFSRRSYGKIAHISDFTPILENTIRAKEKWNMHVEVVTNAIPGYSDDESQMKDLATWIADHLGVATPWHVTRFIPHLRLSHLPATPVATLERIIEIGKSCGLQFVYIGNVPGHPLENTYCPSCGELLIRRVGYSVSECNLEGNCCIFCGAPIPIVGEVLSV